MTRLPALRARLAIMLLCGNAPLCFAAAQNSGADTALQTLLNGSANGEPFSLSATDREQPVGGEIRIGKRRFTITQVSRHGLIGAQRSASSEEPNAPFAEYAVFSSSFSPQTATGQPWVAAQTFHNCDQPYNSFLAIYHVAGSDAALSLKDGPFADLTASANASDNSITYCFVSSPPAE